MSAAEGPAKKGAGKEKAGSAAKSAKAEERQAPSNSNNASREKRASVETVARPAVPKEYSVGGGRVHLM